MLNRFLKLIDFNKPVKHVSFGEMRRQHDRDRQRTLVLFRLIIIAALVTVAVMWIWQSLM